MTTDTNGSDPRSRTEEFERALRSLVLESFAGGAEIEGKWQITPSSRVVPDWTITIEKTSEAAVPDDRVFLDE